MDVAMSKIIFTITPLIGSYAFVVPAAFTQLCEYFNKESLVQLFRESIVEQKKAFFNTCFNPNVSLQNQYFPMDTSFFNDENQSVISLMSQFLGLDTDIYVTKSLMSLLFKVSIGQVESSQSNCLKFHEFLAKGIHS